MPLERSRMAQDTRSAPTPMLTIAKKKVPYKRFCMVEVAIKTISDSTSHRFASEGYGSAPKALPILSGFRDAVTLTLGETQSEIRL